MSLTVIILFLIESVMSLFTINLSMVIYIWIMTRIFDDRFFMYFEDFDLIRRLHWVGKTVFLPDAEIVHDHAAESYKSRKMLAAHIQSAIRYFNKWGWLFDRERRAWNRQILESIAFKAK